MRLNRIVWIAVVVVTSAAGTPRAQGGVTDMLRSDLRTQKAALVTEAMALSEADAERFWPIYGEYEAELKAINDERIAIIGEFARQYTVMSDDAARDLTKRVFKVDESRTKLLKKYARKMEKALSARTAARWVQVERSIDAAIDLQVASELPLLR